MAVVVAAVVVVVAVILVVVAVIVVLVAAGWAAADKMAIEKLNCGAWGPASPAQVLKAGLLERI